MEFEGVIGGLKMSVIAFSIVFLVIVGLMLMMMFLKSVANTINAMNDAKKAAPAASSASAPAATSSSASVAQVSSDDDELLAVITAAIAATCGAGARVASFTPAPPQTLSSTWRMTGRLQNSEGFLD